MNQQPPYQPPLQTQPLQPTVPSQQPQAPNQPNSKKLAITALVLGIVGLLTGFIGIGILLGLIAVVLGTISLVTHRGGGGMAIAGIVTGGIALVLGGLFFLITLTAYGGIQKRATTTLNQSAANHIVQSAEVYNAMNGTLDEDKYPTYDQLLADTNGIKLDEDTKSMLHNGSAGSVTKEHPIAYDSCSEGATIYYYDATTTTVGFVTTGYPDKC